jgi:hypothetical protein
MAGKAEHVIMFPVDGAGHALLPNHPNHWIPYTVKNIPSQQEFVAETQHRMEFSWKSSFVNSRAEIFLNFVLFPCMNSMFPPPFLALKVKT